ncbi:uncharacterized protein [Triticum aestivum]|uniref:uncharacterized protein n=1 Tax=Triticum aestivum TaxID=4565 RepID=UPI001D01194F|nr:uncharacterized protein LOC123043580 [Triticum aestivum]XP_044322007.1 uncharacterized protein LOC123043580 [Triticum aestivum]XP_044322008.1 uncharacterized protein LOC123043580 [Triticum aestivum]XP_044322009.1 uncharacterized protein LOC123043580 [Triticum aestivum]
MWLFFSFSSTRPFLDAINNFRFDYITSRHYAHVVHPHFENAQSSSMHQLLRDRVLSKGLTNGIQSLDRVRLRSQSLDWAVKFHREGCENLFHKFSPKIPGGVSPILEQAATAPSKQPLPSAQTKLVLAAMGENSESIQSTLATLLTKFEAMDLRISNLGKQIEATQENVDAIRHRQAEAGATPTGSGVTEQGATSTTLPVPRLANLQPPLLGTPAEHQEGQVFTTAPPLPVEQVPGRDPPPETRQQVRPGREHVPEPRREFAAARDQDSHVKPPKHHFPRFAGENPRLWLDQALTYFNMYRVPEHHWVSTATLYLEGHAALWWQAFKQRRRLWPWDDFAMEIALEFGQGEYESHMTRILQLKQLGTVTEYKTEFESAMYNLIALDPSLNSKFFISQFVLGLKDDIRAAVRLQSPTSVTRAVCLAKIQEEELDLQRPRQRFQRHTPIQTVPAVIQPVQQAGKKATDDFGRERQLRDFRKANGLCFRCGDKYSKEHQCKKPMQLLTIQVGEHGEILTEDAVQALELLTEPTTSECCQISAHAV